MFNKIFINGVTVRRNQNFISKFDYCLCLWPAPQIFLALIFLPLVNSVLKISINTEIKGYFITYFNVYSLNP